MENWPVGVFTSIDAGLGVDLAVANELGIPTIQIHAPHAGNRGQKSADEIVWEEDWKQAPKGPGNMLKWSLRSEPVGQVIE